MTDTLKSMRKRGNLRGRKKPCNHSLNLKKYELVNFYSYKLIEHITEGLTHIQSIAIIIEWTYPLNWLIKKMSLELHQNLDFHNSCIKLEKFLNSK